MLHKPCFLNYFSSWELLLIYKTKHYFRVFTFAQNKKDFEEIISPKLLFSLPYIACILLYIPNYAKLRILWLSILKTCVHIKNSSTLFFLSFTIQIMYSYLLEIVFNLLGMRYNEYNLLKLHVYFSVNGYNLCLGYYLCSLDIFMCWF